MNNLTFGLAGSFCASMIRDWDNGAGELQVRQILEEHIAVET